MANDCGRKISQKLQVKRPRRVSWKCPQEGVIKLNTDGAVNTRNGKVSARGIFWDNNGRWVYGFWINIGNASIEMAELWGVREGLRTAKEKRMTNIEVESNSSFLLRTLNMGLEVNRPFLVQEFRSYMEDVNISSGKHILWISLQIWGST
ncbi:Ribonuclease H domain [Dillenia turbinata]|uniref:Ribonuclease H domain n=1 Tax=Dillenia turbinata TaxID=194707 RepID=A0AAN8VAN0_9MAGN